MAFVKGFGRAETDGAPFVPASLFRIASISKPFTSVAIMRMVERGRLRLDAKVFGPQGVLSDYEIPATNRMVEAISVDHLLTHTSGGWPNDNRDPMFRNPHMDHRQLIAWTLQNQAPDHPPGVHYAYSNFGYCVLGRVIERISTQPYAEHVRMDVLTPCGITDMRIAANAMDERAQGEVHYKGQNGENPYGINVRRMDSHGGWISTARDLVHFMTHVDGSAGPRLLKPETLALMTTPPLADSKYARGWMINGRNWFHNGGLPGTASILVRTGTGFSWAALTNSRNQAIKPDSGAALDTMMWDMVRKVRAWSV
jgi:CubicO group peptidase (beta-lactamase class C family)